MIICCAGFRLEGGELTDSKDLGWSLNGNVDRVDTSSWRRSPSMLAVEFVNNAGKYIPVFKFQPHFKTRGSSSPLASQPRAAPSAKRFCHCHSILQNCHSSAEPRYLPFVPQFRSWSEQLSTAILQNKVRWQWPPEPKLCRILQNMIGKCRSTFAYPP